MTVSKYGDGGGSATFGANSSALIGAQQTTVIQTNFRITQGGGMWSQNLGTDVSGTEGYGLTCADGNFPSISAGITVEGWFQMDNTEDGDSAQGVLWTLSTAGYPGLLSLQGDPHNNVFQLWATAPGGASFTTDIGTLNYAVLYHVVYTTTTTSYTLWVNGAEMATGSYGFAGGKLASPQFAGFAVNSPLIYGPNIGIPPYSGFAGQVAIFPRILHPARIVTHYQAGITGMAGEPAYYRIERLLQAGNATGRRVIEQEPSPDQDKVVSCQDITGQPASTSIANVTADLLPGLFFIAPTGDMVYQAKVNSWNQPVQWLLGDDGTAGEYAYENDINFDFDPSRVINEIQLTQLDDQSVTTPSVVAIEDASQEQYGTISDLATGYLQGDINYPLNYGPGLQDLANWLACTYQAPVIRLTKVTVDAASQPSAWPFVLSVSPGDMVTVNRRQFTSTPLISVTGRVTHTERALQYDLSGITGSVTCLIDPAPEEFALACDDTVRGLLNGTDVLGW